MLFRSAGTEQRRADTLSKLASAFTPAQQQTDEFGMPKGPPPAHPMQRVVPGLQAMQMFPLQYGQPTLEATAMATPDPQPQPPPGQPQPPPPMQGGPQMMPQQQMPSEEAQMPGGLPLNPMLAGMAPPPPDLSPQPQ